MIRILVLGLVFACFCAGADVDKALANNIWISKYANYTLYKNIQKELESAKAELKRLKDTPNETDIKNKISSLEAQADLLKDYANSPLNTLLAPPNIKAQANITNPLALFGGFSHLKALKAMKESYNQSLRDLKSASVALNEKLRILEKNATLNKNEISSLKAQIAEFDVAGSVAQTTFEIYSTRIDESIADTSAKITDQIKQSLMILGTIALVFVIGIVLKVIIHHYLKNNQKFYTINKVINVTGFIIIVFILLFAYIENVNYLVTILGFASAGLAIAMKDMFMSLLGWSVIVAGGSFHVGDRVRVRFQNSDVVGDIIDISLLRMTLYEDITLTTYRENRRSGRIIFIPNNYIFTETIANYTHSGMKTVWDGIDVLITFESNHKKAVYIIKNIVRQYSKGFTEVAKTKMNKLRDQYSIKNTNVEPRIFTFFEPYGINISVWYETNSYATLALRSTISAEIIDAIKNEPDIKIAYPKETLYLGRDERAKTILNSDESEIL